MGEPLSNLDAKLRVHRRTEIAKIHEVKIETAFNMNKAHFFDSETEEVIRDKIRK